MFTATFSTDATAAQPNKAGKKRGRAAAEATDAQQQEQQTNTAAGGRLRKSFEFHVRKVQPVLVGCPVLPLKLTTNKLDNQEAEVGAGMGVFFLGGGGVGWGGGGGGLGSVCGLVVARVEGVCVCGGGGGGQEGGE